MKEKWKRMYLEMARLAASYSKANKLKVGAVFVSEHGVLSLGINGMPAGGSNICEDSLGMTLPEVAHAEENLIFKLLKEGVSTKNGSIYLTHSPCIRCCRILANAGITEIFYIDKHREVKLSQDYLSRHFPEVKLINFEL